MKTYKIFSRTSRTATVLLGAVVTALAMSSLPAGAITPTLPITVDASARTQVERNATTLRSLYTATGIRPERAGEGVRVGVVDSGISVYAPGNLYATNPCFSDAGYAPTAQAGDTRYTNNKVVVARVLSEVEGSNSNGFAAISAEAVGAHGSHVAGIIGCNLNTQAKISGTPVGTISGVAPRVLLGSYNIFPNGSGYGTSNRIIARAIDAAVQDGMQILNLSIGTAAYEGETEVLEAIDRAEAAGVLVVVAAGNEGPDAGTVSAPGIFHKALTVGSVDGGRRLVTTMAVNKKKYTGPVGSIGIPVRKITAPLLPIFEADGSTLSLACSSADIPPSVKDKVAVIRRGECFFTEKLENLLLAGAAGAVIVNEPGRTLDPLSSIRDTQMNLAAIMVSPKDGATIVAAARAGASASFSPPRLTVADRVNMMSEFSSSGPAQVTGLGKPDVVAPGANVLSAAAAPSLGSSCASTGSCFQLMSGTSMATPFVAGVAAVLRQAHPEWSVQQLRSALIHTANPNGVRGTQGLFRSGNGLIDPSAAAKAKIGFAETSLLIQAGAGATTTLLNATSAPLTVKLSASTGLRVPTSVVVPAGGSVPVMVISAGTAPGGSATITASVSGSKIRMKVRIA